MPIRLCEKCGLKVLIDETQTIASPFMCQRCASLPAGDTARADDPPPPSSPSQAKGGPLKLVCPYCKGTFSGRVPSKPAKGSCPVCRKELILLPNGTIQQAAAFDASKTIADSEPTVDDQMAAAQHAIEKARAAKEEPKPAPKPPPPKPKPAVPPPPPKPAPRVETAPAKSATPVTKPPAPRPVPPIAPPQPMQAPPQGGGGKVVFALVLLVLPLGIGGAMWKLREGSLKTVVEKLGAFGANGLRKVYSKVRAKTGAPAQEKKASQVTDSTASSPRPPDLGETTRAARAATRW